MTDHPEPVVAPPLPSGSRYTVRITMEPSEELIEYRAVTALGELKAAAMAALRLIRDRPEARFSKVEIVNVETDYSLDPANDLRDYWGLE